MVDYRYRDATLSDITSEIDYAVANNLWLINVHVHLRRLAPENEWARVVIERTTTSRWLRITKA